MLLKIQIFENSKCIDKMTISGRNTTECVKNLVKVFKEKGSVKGNAVLW